MKLMRSRFRLIALLLACVFLLTAVVCTASVLKQAGVTVPAVQQILPASESPSPEASPAGEETNPEPSVTPENENASEETDIQPDSEYNIFGL